MNISPTNSSPDFTHDSGDGFAAVRASGFLSKVLFFFGMALLISAAGTYVWLEYLAVYFIQNPALMYGSFAVELILVFTARFWSAARPLNYFLFALFALLSGMTLSPLLANVVIEFGGFDLIIKALIATTMTFASAAMIGVVSKRSFSGIGGFLFMTLIGMIIVSIVGIFVPWGNTFEMIFSGVGVALFAGYTMYDIQRLKQYPEDRYIDAALQLYLDIFNMFVYILRLISGISRSR